MKINLNWFYLLVLSASLANSNIHCAAQPIVDAQEEQTTKLKFVKISSDTIKEIINSINLNPERIPGSQDLIKSLISNLINERTDIEIQLETVLRGFGIYKNGQNTNEFIMDLDKNKVVDVFKNFIIDCIHKMQDINSLITSLKKLLI